LRKGGKPSKNERRQGYGQKSACGTAHGAQDVAQDIQTGPAQKKVTTHSAKQSNTRKGKQK
jgi:hypothetical protein